jgi:hypothetical protein
MDDINSLARLMEPRAWAALGKENDNTKHRDARVLSIRHSAAVNGAVTKGGWITIEADAAHYVSEGRERIICDRLPRPVTLVVKLASIGGSRGDARG